MLMSHEAISSAVITRPRFGLSPRAGLDTSARADAAARRRLGISMRYLPVLGDAPARDPVEMIESSVAALGDELGASRLDEAGFVGGATLEDRGSTIPAPRRAESCE